MILDFLDKGLQVNSIEKSFLDNSIAMRDQKFTEENDRKEKELVQARELAEKNEKLSESRKKIIKRTYIFLSIVSLLLVVSLFAGYFAWNQEKIATINYKESQKQFSLNLASIADSLLDGDRKFAGFLLSLHTVKSNPTIKALNVLDKAVYLNSIKYGININDAKIIKRLNDKEILIAYPEYFAIYTSDGSKNPIIKSNDRNNNKKIIHLPNDIPYFLMIEGNLLKLFKINLDNFAFDKIEEKLIKEDSLVSFIESYDYIDHGIYSCLDLSGRCLISSKNNNRPLS